MVVVKIVGQEGLARVLSGMVGMTFVVDKFTDGARGRVAHVRDYRYPNRPGGFQIWSIGAEGYEEITSMKTITRNDLTERDPHRFVAFASDLGLAPGHWPDTMMTSIGNGRPLGKTFVAANRDGEVEYVRYDQWAGCVSVQVFND